MRAASEVGGRHQGDGRPLIPAMRVVAFASLALTAIGFGDFYLAAQNTADYSPWTINPPMSAAFLGAGYGAGVVLFVQGRAGAAVGAPRLAIITVWGFTVVTLIATLMHRGNSTSMRAARSVASRHGCGSPCTSGFRRSSAC